MIPRVRPSYSRADLCAAWRSPRDVVAAFEGDLATHFGVRHALVFPYGRSAIHAFLRALTPGGAEVVQPAYNCVVVAHATVLAGCRPVFVDSQATSPNQDPEEMVQRVGSGTFAVVPTSMFGMTFDAPALCAAIRRRNPNALILMDCCQCFDAGWRGESLASQGDAAVLAFGIGKPMTTLLGGALLTNREDVYAAVRSHRDAIFVSRPLHSVFFRWGYFLSSWLALSGPAVGLTDWLENVDSPLHRYLLRLRAREEIRLPADNATLMTGMEAAIGRAQLQRVNDFIRRREEIAGVYARELGALAGVQLLDWPEGSSYAIYAARLNQPATRQQVLGTLRRHGVQGDTTLSYVVPGLECYRAVGYDARPFPNAGAWARSVINLPNHPTMTEAQVSRVVAAARRALAGLPSPEPITAAGEPCA